MAVKISTLCLILSIFLFTQTICAKQKTAADRSKERYLKLNKLEFDSPCSKAGEDARRQGFLAARKVVFEGLTELEILDTTLFLQVNYPQMFRRANGTGFCDSSKNLICDDITQTCRCAQPSFLENGKCVLPKGVACPEKEGMCANGTRCLYTEDRVTSCDDHRAMIWKVTGKYLGESLAWMARLFNAPKFDVDKVLTASEDSLDKTIETEAYYLCKCL